MNTNERKPIRFTQLMTVVYETSYTRQEALELLKLSGSEVAHEGVELTNQQLAEAISIAANTEYVKGYGELYTRLTDDAGPDWVDTTNIGAIFRSAAALGIDGVLLTRNSCDPLNRRAVRVSMGTVFLVPWTWLDAPLQSLNSLGFKTVAMALSPEAITLDDPVLKTEPRLALVMGTEGDGLPRDTIAGADYVVRIPMSRGTDSLNVAAASAVAFWELRTPRNLP